MQFRCPNMVSQAALYKTGSPNYFSTTTGAATVGPNGEAFKTFPDEATASSWTTGDQVAVLAVKDNGDYKIWVASWDSSALAVKLVTEEATTGTWVNDDVVTLSAVMSSRMASLIATVPLEFQSSVISATEYIVSAADSGKSLCFTHNSGCAVTLDAALPVGFQVQIIQEGYDAVLIDCEGFDKLNGVGTGVGVSTAAQYSSKFVYQRTEGMWVAV